MDIIKGSLVFEKRNFPTGNIEALLFCLSKIRPLVKCKFRIVNERIVDIVVFRCRIFLRIMIVSITTSQQKVEWHLTRRFFFFPPSVSGSLSLTGCLVTAILGGGVGGRCPESLASFDTSISYLFGPPSLISSRMVVSGGAGGAGGGDGDGDLGFFERGLAEEAAGLEEGPGGAETEEARPGSPAGEAEMGGGLEG